MSEEQGTQDIITAMMTHKDNAALLESACAALWTLSVEGMQIHARGVMWLMCAQMRRWT